MITLEITQDDVHSGILSTRSGSVFDGETIYILKVAYLYAEGFIGFVVHVASGAAQKGLMLQIDGQPIGIWSGEYEWTDVLYPISTGIHTYKSEYEVHPSVSEDIGAVWIDDIARKVYGDEFNLLNEILPATILEDSKSGIGAIGIVIANIEP